MPTPPPSVPQRRLARQARQKFVEGICAGLPEVDKTVLDFLSQLMYQTGTQREMHSRRDAWQLYQQHHTDWIARMDRSLREALAPHIARLAEKTWAATRKTERIGHTVAVWRGEPDAGEYQDIPGYCRSVPLAEIAQHGHVLTPGRYVGAEEVEDNDEDFATKMQQLTEKLGEQMARGAELDALIRGKLGGLGYEF